MNYTVFGETIKGLEVIDKIAAVKTDGNNRPLMNVIMSMEIIK
jgi:peptidyl-prolyl cis-trans isomerase B (cyclophilin B)